MYCRDGNLIDATDCNSDPPTLQFLNPCTTIITHSPDILFLELETDLLGNFNHITSNANLNSTFIDHHIYIAESHFNNIRVQYEIESIIYSCGTHFFTRFRYNSSYYQYDGMDWGNQDPSKKCIISRKLTGNENFSQFLIKRGDKKYFAHFLIYIKKFN
jgi:hypothetical protein